ncbi:Polyisoprenoid-binding protein YceI [Amycolatopsis arida]|uniref:Polyisoprenoid-binding protein YceI n=1 Tax=Amycolatopsis arida TaxID=587909 RepID=A0A1I5Q911_9PSEU|nr:YceI family protein [Amycolatopsis arida]TDX98758.1 polyisoprenoid-binding protein YceI [Amycolatopsis arida]SFP42755.1 Polyisoprenoid-binding protein YceI [Amycolatopsis arida]
MSEATVAAGNASAIEGWVAGTWSIDAAHSAVSFSVRHLMSKVRGRFTEFNGQIVTAEEPVGSSVTASIDLSSVDTSITMRDDHLRSADFFDVEKYPTMEFASTGLRQDDESWVLTGDLTIYGTTRPVEIELDFLGIDPTGMQGETRIGFEGRTTIRRSDFGVSFGLAVDGSKIVVGDKVTIALDIEAVLDA